MCCDSHCTYFYLGVIVRNETYNENTKKLLLMPSSLQFVKKKKISVTIYAGNRHQNYFDSDKFCNKNMDM
jgi:hypothetical protein